MNNINEEQIIKMIDFWQKSVNRGSLYDREIVNNVDIKGKEIIDFVGPRRSGKSSILKLLIRKLKTNNYIYINFEDPFFISNNNPEIIEKILELFKEHFNSNLKYLFFDEIQEIQNWEKIIRKLRDAEDYKIFITGSSSRLLSKEISSLITGRHLSYQVFPLSFREFLTFNNMEIFAKKDIMLKKTEIYKNFNKYLEIGGFPEPVISKNQELLKNYFYDILEKDIVRRYDIREKGVLERLAVYLMSNSGKISSIESLKKIFLVSSLPINSYLSYLKESLLIFELPQFSYSLKKQEKTFKKYYSVDTGLANAVSFQFSQDKGRILENVVFHHLNRNNNKIYYYKTKSNLEVDFLVKEKTKPQMLIQVAWSIEDEVAKKREVKALVEALNELNLNKGLILTNSEKEAIKIDNKTIEIIPVFEWLLSNMY